MSITQLLKSHVHSYTARKEASPGLQSFSFLGWELVSSQPALPASINSRWLELLFQLSSVVQCLFFTNTVSADSENTVVKYDPLSFSVVLGISHVIPRGSQVSLAAKKKKKNPLHCFPEDIEGIVPLIGVRVISNMWLMIYCLEETFICGPVARPRQT